MKVDDFSELLEISYYFQEDDQDELLVLPDSISFICSDYSYLEPFHSLVNHEGVICVLDSEFVSLKIERLFKLFIPFFPVVIF